MGKAHGRIIYHILSKRAWEAARSQTTYAPPSLDAEGFIHCTGEAERLAGVGNLFYRSARAPFVIMRIDQDAVDAHVCWEEADGHLFPHIYGPLNLDAVIDILPFPRGSDGTFLEPGL